MPFLGTLLCDALFTLYTFKVENNPLVYPSEAFLFKFPNSIRMHVKYWYRRFSNRAPEKWWFCCLAMDKEGTLHFAGSSFLFFSPILINSSILNICHASLSFLIELSCTKFIVCITLLLRWMISKKSRLGDAASRGERGLEGEAESVRKNCHTWGSLVCLSLSSSEFSWMIRWCIDFSGINELLVSLYG